MQKSAWKVFGKCIGTVFRPRWRNLLGVIFCKGLLGFWIEVVWLLFDLENFFFKVQFPLLAMFFRLLISLTRNSSWFATSRFKKGVQKVPINL